MILRVPLRGFATSFRQQRGSSDQVHRQGSGSQLGLLLGAGASIAWGIAAAAVALAASNDQSPATQDDDDLEKRNKKAHAELQELLGDRYTLDFDDREAHSRDTNSYHHSRNPFAVVYPLSTEEVSKVVKICARYRLPIIPYGSGTSLEGHTTSPKGGVSVDLSRMDQILQVNVADMDCVVQPGITWNNLNESLLEHKLFFPVDPGPGASIGGMVGTGCSGTNAVRYGTMRVNVINLTVVLPDGSIIKTAQRARKSSAGYDLTRLFVGSEGTLGVITEITLKLQNIPEHTSVATCSFPTIKDAANSVIEIMQKGVQVGCVELLDEECVKSVNAYINTTLEAKPTLFFKFTGRQTQVHDDIQAVSDIVKRHQGGSFQWAKSVDESAKMWEGRKGALWAAAQLREGGQVWTTDVCVPISRFADCIEATKDDLRKSFLPAPVVGHAGDGNFHVLMVMDPNSRKDREEASRLSHLMVERAIEMGGTCTGEHGIGVGKKEYLEKELGEGAVNFMRLLKRSVDPLNIMNPGKIVDVDVSDAAVQQDIARETKPKKSPSVASTVSS